MPEAVFAHDVAWANASITEFAASEKVSLPVGGATNRRSRAARPITQKSVLRNILNKANQCFSQNVVIDVSFGRPCFAPDIVETILDGHQPRELQANELPCPFAMDWTRSGRLFLPHRWR